MWSLLLPTNWPILLYKKWSSDTFRRIFVRHRFIKTMVSNFQVIWTIARRTVSEFHFKCKIPMIFSRQIFFSKGFHLIGKTQLDICLQSFYNLRLYRPHLHMWDASCLLVLQVWCLVLHSQTIWRIKWMWSIEIWNQRRHVQKQWLSSLNSFNLQASKGSAISCSVTFW